MKILPVESIREADAYTIKHEPISGIDLMERAAAECFQWIFANIPADQPIKVFCGTGNNGGDGFAIARMLAGKGYSVDTFLVGDPSKLTPSCRINYQQIPRDGCKVIQMSSDFPRIEVTDVVIDAIFGSGLTRTPEGLPADLIDHINNSRPLVISIDLPSGLFCDNSVKGIKNPVVIEAGHTLSFAPPKFALFFPENVQYTGVWHLLDIGLMQDFIEAAKVSNFFITHEMCEHILHRRNKFDHKGCFGHALLICGATGKMGAAILSAHGCLRSGPGLVTVHVPRDGGAILQTTLPEAMVSVDKDSDVFSSPPDLTAYSSIAVGPGIGKGEHTASALKLLIQNSHLPIIFDADAINILSENKTWLGFLKPGSIFTPHIKEFERLVGKSSNDFERNRLQREFSVKYNAYVALKGANTAITTPGGDCYFNSTGNPGMATGGSGDVLTGITAGLMAQGYSSLDSLLLGVYLHGLAGDLAVASTGFEALIASDIITHLGTAFQTLYGKL